MSKFALSTIICALAWQNATLVLANDLSIGALTEVLRNAKIINAEKSLRLSIGDKKVLILTERGAKSTNKECQIDAVLLAKTLIDTYPDQINLVKVLFSQVGGDKLTQINVTAGDVKAFGSGQISEDDLLSSLDVQEVSAVSAGSGDAGSASGVNLAPGPFMERRLILLQQIDDLQKKGTGVKAFRDLFSQVETDVQKGDEKSAAKDIQYLAEKLDEQQKVVRDLSNPARPIPTGGGSGSQPPGAATPTLPNRSADLLKRCEYWDLRVKKWESEGRDVSQLAGSILIIRGFSTDPAKYDMAKSMLDAMDAMVHEPPFK